MKNKDKFKNLCSKINYRVMSSTTSLVLIPITALLTIKNKEI